MLSVMLVDEDSERREILRSGLERAGHRIVAEVKSTVDLAKRVAKLQPDVIIIDTNSPDRDTLEHICVVTQDTPRPIVMFSADGDSARIREAVRSGVSAYIVGGLEADRVLHVIDLAIAQFETLQQLRSQLASAQIRLADRKSIERAKGILMDRKGISEDAAFALLRKMSMEENLKLVEVAEQVIRTARIL